MAKLFTLPNAFKKDGKFQKKTTVFGKEFTDGQLLLSNDDAQKTGPVLLRFYACTVENIDDAVEEESGEEGSLAASQTK